MKSDFFYKTLKDFGINFFTGVPDSLLKNFISYLAENISSKNHTVSSNEGSAIGLAIGHYLSTKEIPLIYMQNSGLGNAINPIVSLADKDVYSIPMVLLIGWRGDPSNKDEPQHLKQGKVTISLLKTLKIPYIIINNKTKKKEINSILTKSKKMSRPVAIVVKKDTFESYSLQKELPFKKFECTREEAIKKIVNVISKDDIIISTTGMASRELEELKSSNPQFFSIGGMGHASQIALGIAMNKPSKRIICIDGDGAILMHLGSLANIGVSKLNNFNHILLNNGAHSSVGNQPTVGFEIDFCKIANSCQYKKVNKTEKKNNISSLLKENIDHIGTSFLEIKVNTKYRKNLGRPKKSPTELKTLFIDSIVKS